MIREKRRENMKKHLGKIIAFVIGISITGGDVVSVFAADTKQSTNLNFQIQSDVKSILTLDEAIKAAINNSEILALDEKKINYIDKINDISEKVDDNPRLVGKIEIEMPDEKKDLNKDTHEIQLKQAKQQRDFDEDKLIQKVTAAYNNIVTSQMKIDKAKRDIDQLVVVNIFLHKFI